jgi:hypothetical protein
MYNLSDQFNYAESELNQVIVETPKSLKERRFGNSKGDHVM